MQGQLANLISLVACGNSYLAFQDEEALARAQRHFGVEYIYPDFLFLRRGGLFQLSEAAVASSPDDWFRWLRGQGAARLSYIAFGWDAAKAPGLPESAAAAFSNGVAMAIQAELSGGKRELWYPSWTVDRSDLTRKRVWRVRYHAKPVDADYRVPVTPELAAPRLGQALEAAAAFAASHAGDGPWTTLFNKARTTLASSAAPQIGPDSLLPRYGYSDAARRLLASADEAWVFGGMGSWNDLGWSEPPVQEQYGVVTGQLYDAVKSACVAAANAFDPALGPGAPKE